jgi:hypothetical protein
MLQCPDKVFDLVFTSSDQVFSAGRVLCFVCFGVSETLVALMPAAFQISDIDYFLY